MKNKCEKWGQYQGYQVLRCYGDAGKASLGDFENVYGDGRVLYYDGHVCGKTDDKGCVSGWVDPKSTFPHPKKQVVVETTSAIGEQVADEVLKKAMNRPLSELLVEF